MQMQKRHAPRCIPEMLENHEVELLTAGQSFRQEAI